jgi:outer membrane murein-binding lipoprotein Lpp
MSDTQLNGDARVILFRMNQHSEQIEKLSAKVDQIHDKLVGMPTLCPAPGTCLKLAERIDDQDGRIRHLEKLEVRIYTVTALVAFGFPLALKYFL